MDTVEQYREIIKRVLIDYAKIPYSYGEIDFEHVFDRDTDRYLLMISGWEGPRRVHGCLLHIDIINDNVWIQRDGSEHGIALDLEEAGIPKDRIVLAFQPPYIREHTDYAVA